METSIFQNSRSADLLLDTKYCPQIRFHFELQVVKGAAGLVGDVLTFKWASATMAQAAVNTVVVAEVSANLEIGQ